MTRPDGVQGHERDDPGPGRVGMSLMLPPTRYVVVLHDPNRGMDYLTIGPFEVRDEATEEAGRWRAPGVRAMVRYLWDGNDLRREMREAGQAANP